ncbi:hypothetical protein Patl1_10979 [Pistacia atlantica]|uniref:Uncharacterized protein n=1 Tax=Pistacia atlantica TaxID=434234 RepID=A0ACC1A030_9ROSI|nr:hypothetical protein Patl1_10979 [Pistacia atlantica]
MHPLCEAKKHKAYNLKGQLREKLLVHICKGLQSNQQTLTQASQLLRLSISFLIEV